MATKRNDIDLRTADKRTLKLTDLTQKNMTIYLRGDEIKDEQREAFSKFVKEHKTETTTEKGNEGRSFDMNAIRNEFAKMFFPELVEKPYNPFD